MPGKKKSTKGKTRKEKKGMGTQNRTLTTKEESQEYAQVESLLGDCRVKLSCQDGMERIGKIRGKMRHRQRIRPGDWVLASLRDFQDNKCDIILKYADDEVRQLRNMQEINDAKQGDGTIEDSNIDWAADDQQVDIDQL